MSASAIGLILAAGSLGQAAIRPFTNILLRRTGLVVTMVVAALIAVVGLTVMPLTSLVWLLMALAFVHGVGAGLHQSLGLVLLAEATSDDERGYAVGLRATVNQVSSAGAPLLAGGLADVSGTKSAFYVIGGLLLLSTFSLRSVLQRAERHRKAGSSTQAVNIAPKEAT
jgi:MFS family permease